jgi:hypothetical protein
MLITTSRGETDEDDSEHREHQERLALRVRQICQVIPRFRLVVGNLALLEIKCRVSL